MKKKIPSDSDPRQIGFWPDQYPPVPEETGTPFTAMVDHISKELYSQVARMRVADPSITNQKAVVAALLKTAAEIFVGPDTGTNLKLDPRWFLGLANAFLAVVAHQHGIAIDFPIDPLLLPEEGKDVLIVEGLVKAREVKNG
ncbi:MAG: hypothetical protein GYA36_19050 [Veillonellaceae bacterium]|nr:hypothetical protein [Veillonellaceae bacterium]